LEKENEVILPILLSSFLGSDIEYVLEVLRCSLMVNIASS